jgi:hypothetical protein
MKISTLSFTRMLAMIVRGEVRFQRRTLATRLHGEGRQPQNAEGMGRPLRRS